MHDTALSLGKLFFNTYLTTPSARILDVGSMDVNGSLRLVAPQSARYLGLDIEPGKGVDAVAPPGDPFPFDTDDFDVVVSTSCFEHDPMFWNTFTEMVRVVRPGGLIYINAPSNGIYHAHPLDCWRFYPDAGVVLARWASEWCDMPTELVESFIARRQDSGWNDCVMVFAKAPTPPLPRRFMSDQFPSYNVRRRGLLSGLIRAQTESEEQQLQGYLARNSSDLLQRWLAQSEGSDPLSFENTRLRAETAAFLKTFGVTT